MTHLITCQGRDHIVSIQSGRHNLVIVNVHFEPESTLRQLRDRLHLVHPHWPSYSNGVGVILGDVNICDPEPDIHRWWPEKDCHVPLIFPHVLDMAQPDYTRRDSTALGIIRTCRELIVFFSIYLWLKHVMFTVPLVFSRTWEIEPFRVITQQYASSFKSQQIEDTRLNVFPAGCPNISFSVPFVQRLHDDHRFLLIRLVRSQNSKFFLKRPRD